MSSTPGAPTTPPPARRAVPRPDLIQTERATPVQWIEALRKGLIERDVEAGLLILALVAEEHVLLIGAPGTAKSLLATALCQMLTGSQFSILLTRFTTPEEVYGPLSLKGLESDEYRRVTKGYLPTAKIGFLDEIFRANSAILNTLLPILNERIYFEGGRAWKVPLELLVGAANDLPEEDSPLGALYDRFLIRRFVKPIQSRENFAQYLESDVQPERVVIKPADLAAVRAAARKVILPAKAVTTIIALKEHVERQKILVSDRRWKKLVKLAKASAAINGQPVVTPNDFVLLPDALWEKPEQADGIRQWLNQNNRW